MRYKQEFHICLLCDYKGFMYLLNLNLIELLKYIFDILHNIVPELNNTINQYSPYSKRNHVLYTV